MSEADDPGIAEAPAELALDPFSFSPGIASRIGGLGGDLPSAEPNYAFHTPYVPAAIGPCHFTVRFSGLTARQGILQLRVHMIGLEPGSVARMANMDRIALNRLVQCGGEFSIKFEGFRGYGFALMGLILGETDARADDLVVTLDRPPSSSDDGEAASDGLTTVYGRETTRPVPLLVSPAAPTFAAPVSQICTREQLSEPAFRKWRRELDLNDADDIQAWRQAFVLQALRCYGMLEEGARGVALDASSDRLGKLVSRHGPDVVVAAPAADTGFFASAVVDFDFAFSGDLLPGTGDARETLQLFESSMHCLRPGGLMVHVAAVDLAARFVDAVPQHGTLSLSEIERMALLAISRKHDVAQLKLDRARAAIDKTRPGEIGAVGLILRRTHSVF